MAGIPGIGGMGGIGGIGGMGGCDCSAGREGTDEMTRSDVNVVVTESTPSAGGGPEIGSRFTGACLTGSGSSLGSCFTFVRF